MIDNIRKAEPGEIEKSIPLTDSEVKELMIKFKEEISRSDKVLSVIRSGSNRVLFQTVVGQVKYFLRKRKEDGKILIIAE